MTHFADPGFQGDGQKRFPISTEAEIRASWETFSPEIVKYSADQASHVRANLTSAWKALIDRSGPPAETFSSDMKRVAVFGVGNWTSANGQPVSYTEEMLDQMIATFNELGDKVAGFRAPLKLGHTENQRFIGQDAGAPAMGWVTKLYREGKKLYADFKNVPSALLDMIRNGAYNSVSIEILPSLDYDNRNFRNVLCAVAILGSEWPAVKGLPELSAALFSDKPEKIALTECKMTTDATLKFSQEHVDALVTQARTTFATEHKAQVETLTAENTKQTERAERAELALQTFKDDSSKATVTALVEDAVKNGQILPADKDEMIAFGMQTISTGPLKFGDKTKQPLDVFKDLIGRRAKTVNFKEKGAGNGEEKDKSAVEEVDRKAKAAMAADSTGKLSYKDAVMKVTTEDPQLKQAWLLQS